ncbi:MAG: uncharacterized protein PWQ22_829 [Archaeoglobaceae archaeon]|nr:uncharacterized protein [Archaeoglobaceae archaeon]MDK2876419.1 uncharacterized protein [Archaeoglobaceae archaeon]
MRIIVRVKPNAKKRAMEKIGEEYVVSLKSPPIDGRANAELIEIVSEYFKVPKSKIRIVAGQKSRKKILEID